VDGDLGKETDMRLSKAWIVASKDFKTFTKKKTVLYSIIYFEGIISIALPFVVRFIANKPDTTQLLPAFINAFSFWYVIGATFLPVGVASYSLIGEKLQKSLEPLLATPTTDEEILLGKTLAAFIPAVGVNFIGAALFCVLVDVFTRSTLGYLYYPNGDIFIIVFLLAPLACILAVGYNILISSRVNDARTAYQLGVLIILPLAAIYVLSEIQILTLSTTTFLIIAAVLAIIDVIVFFLARATFQRDEILTKWK
jgi:ABC-2 type transport system permease protein